jgi:uncharacterized protein YkwD
MVIPIYVILPEVKTSIMRLFIVSLFFLLPPNFTYGQNVVNNDSVLYHFNFILNDYRMMNGLNPMVIDLKIKPFTESWANHMSSVNMVYHGEDTNSFPNRAKNYFPRTIYCVETCCSVTTPKKLDDGYITCPIKELIPIIRKTYDGTATQFDYAYFAFILWKSSPTHNAALLDPNIKKFYLSSSPSKDLTYMEFVGTN